MCCNADAEAKREFLAELGPRKTFIAWKRVCPNGAPWVALLWQIPRFSRYRPGINIDPYAPKRRYNSGRPRGFHVYLVKPDLGHQHGGTLVEVHCHCDDLIAVEFTKDLNYTRQAVVRKLTIRRKDWKAAGLPPYKVKK